ncbi:DMT family transporter [Fulvivirga sp. 29W222]|uniref:DMT family transporter n=1 Tax=Fulvivirga marina TaxID=2494733 RepID=A0A937G112_9BACT|nr:DMT family transporter [Fulvivirga marina]MBL6449830.1 DMT family transporter [Fulvivirga marina]
MTKENNPNLLAWGLLLILALIWGSSFILIKRGLDIFSAGEVGAIRIVSASLFLLPFGISRLKTVQKKHWIFLFSVGMFGSFLPAFLFAKAQTHIPSSVAGIINALTPLFTMILGALFFTQKITAKTAIGLITGFLGTAALILAGSGGNVSEFNLYGLYVVLATIFYGANLNIIKFKMPDLTAMAITSVSLLIVGPVAITYLFVFTNFANTVQTVDGALFSLGAVVVLGVMGTALALILFNQLVKITSPIFASSVTYLIPIIAVLWGLLDGERLYIGHYLGLVLIILGVYLANRNKKQKIKIR